MLMPHTDGSQLNYISGWRNLYLIFELCVASCLMKPLPICIRQNNVWAGYGNKTGEPNHMLDTTQNCV